MGGDIPGLVTLGSIRKTTNQAMMNKPVNRAPPPQGLYFSSCFQVPALLEFLHSLLLMSCDLEV